jgi:hypothetical protein
MYAEVTGEIRMSQRRQSTKPTTDLEFHASGFMVKVHGSWTDTSLKQFRHFLRVRRLEPAHDQLMALLANARQQYLNGQARLSLCHAQPCRARIGFDTSDDALEHVAKELDVPISKTGCQGPCKQAPIVSLRVGNRSEMFAQVSSPEDWQIILNFVKAVRQSGTLLIDAGQAEQFRFDPVHAHRKPDAHLKPLQFLLGHFRGEGKYAMVPYSFQKEVIGTMEAGGRFIALRMDVAYPLTDGQIDVHKALVIAGAELSSGKIAAHAYTDGGLVREYSVENRKAWLEFEDQPPSHEKQWTRARKILQPTETGFEERLEVDPGGGNFTPYYVIQMRKIVRK